MTTRKPSAAPVAFCCLLALVLSDTAAYAGKVVGRNLDAQLGVRFLTPLPAKMPPGSKVEAIVTTPEKLTGLGLESVKQGDKVTLITGPQDDFSIKHAGKSLPLKINPEGFVTRGGRVGAPAGAIQEEKPFTPSKRGDKGPQGVVK